jgi:hypothetical protein
MRTIVRVVSLCIAIVALANSADALTVPYLEDFSVDTANWRNNANGSLTFNAAGGPDGSSYASTDFAFSSAVTDSVILFRGQSNFPSSGNAFSGNWIAENVQRLSASIRHIDPVGLPADLELSFFLRVATSNPAAGGVIFLYPDTIGPDTWTEMDFDISFANPNRVNEGAPSLAFYENVLSNVARVQFGVSVPVDLIENTTAVTYGLDKVSIVPEPSSALLCVMAFAGAAIRRRRRG